MRNKISRDDIGQMLGHINAIVTEHYLASIDLEKGLQTITLHTVETGDMNYDYLNFELIK